MSIQKLKEDFEAFSKGVQRLEQLKAEFENIDTSGHEQEADAIKPMLKNVSSIPELENKIAILRDAVNRKKQLAYTYRHAYPRNIENQIKELKDIVLNLKITKPTTKVTRKELEELYQIPFIEKQLAEVIEKIEHLSARKGAKLTRKDIINIEDVPKIEEHLNILRLQIDKNFDEEKRIELEYKLKLKGEVVRIENELRAVFNQKLEEEKTALIGKYDSEFKSKLKGIELEKIEYIKNKENELRAYLQLELEKELSNRLEDEKTALIGKYDSEFKSKLRDIELEKIEYIKNKENELRANLQLEFEKELSKQVEMKNLNFKEILKADYQRKFLENEKKLREDLQKEFETKQQLIKKELLMELEKEKHLLKGKSDSEFNAKIETLAKKNSEYLEAKEKELIISLKEKNLEYLQERENTIKSEALASFNKERQFLIEKNEFEMRSKIKEMEIEKMDYLKKREYSFKQEISKKFEEHYRQKLLDKEKQLKRILDEEFKEDTPKQKDRDGT